MTPGDAGFGAAVLRVFAAGGSAPAQSGSVPPVTIDRCAPIIHPSTQASPGPLFAGIPLAQTSSGMSIGFVNNASKVATHFPLRRRSSST